MGWTAPSTIGFLVAAAVLLIAFLMVESRVRNPLMPMWLLRNRNRGGAYLIFLLVAAGLFAMFLFLTFYFQVVLGYTR